MDGNDWWAFPGRNDTNCTVVDYIKVLQYSLQVLPFHIATDKENVEDEEVLVSNLQLLGIIIPLKMGWFQ